MVIFLLSPLRAKKSNNFAIAIVGRALYNFRESNQEKKQITDNYHNIGKINNWMAP